MANVKYKKQLMRRKRRVRRKIFGTPERPRLAVKRTNKHIYAQVIDDTEAKTMAYVSSLDKELQKSLKYSGNTEAAQKVGSLIASRAKAAGITKVVFDRGSSLYHGRVKALAEAAREGGLDF